MMDIGKIWFILVDVDGFLWIFEDFDGFWRQNGSWPGILELPGAS